MRGMSRRFPGVQALDNVDLRVQAGEIHAILGENGAGKSTLMRILAGAERSDEGQIHIDGTPAQITSPHDAIVRGISMVYQETNLAPHLSVAENIFLGRLPNHGGVVDHIQLRRKARELQSRLNLRLPLQELVRDLPIAQQQMTEIARALSTNVRILILDEPTSALTETEIEELFRVVRELKRQGVAIVYISHNLDEIFRLCDTVTVLRDGRNVGDRLVTETSVGELIRMMVGRTLIEMFPKQQVPRGEEVLRVDELRVPGKRESVSFSAYRGEVLGFAGLIGAGRTALMRTIIGAIRSEGGRIVVNGRPVRMRSPHEAIRRGIGYLTDDRRRSGLAGVLSVQQNLSLASLPQFSAVGVINPTKERRAAATVVRSLRIVTPSLNQPVRLLSGGNQQKVVIGKWLTAGVQILIFDEPTRGIDVGAKVEVYRLINQLVKDGKTVLMISSYLPELLAMADRILVMRGGAIVSELSHEEATQEKIMYAATGQVATGDETSLENHPEVKRDG
jgi:ribose transport system ATP-binding protein